MNGISFFAEILESMCLRVYLWVPADNSLWDIPQGKKIKISRRQACKNLHKEDSSLSLCKRSIAQFQTTYRKPFESLHMSEIFPFIMILEYYKKRHK